MDVVIPTAMIVMGLGIAVVWTRDILAGTHVDVRDDFFAARDPDSGSLFWPHWLAEFATAGLLIVSAIGLLVGTTWSPISAGIGAGALLYTSMNSLGWSLAKPDRRSYAAPMVVGVFVGLATCVHLLIRY